MRRISACLAAMLPSLAWAGAWTEPQGQGIAIINATYYTTNRYFDTHGTLRAQARFSKYELQPYLDYGLTPVITLGGSAYLDAVSQSGDTNRGIADPELFVRGRVYADDRQVVSLEPLVKFPSSFDHSATPQGGSKSRDVQLSLRYGRSMALISAGDYTDLRLGYRVRSRGLSDQWLLDAAIGLKPNGRWEITPALRATLANAPAKAATFTENGELDYSLLKAEIGATYHLTAERAVQATLFEHVAGVQTGDGFGITLGFAQRF